MKGRPLGCRGWAETLREDLTPPWYFNKTASRLVRYHGIWRGRSTPRTTAGRARIGGGAGASRAKNSSSTIRSGRSLRRSRAASRSISWVARPLGNRAT